MKKKLELYIHIPFCVRKCEYCDFLSAPASDDTMRRYLDALLEEIRSFRCEGSYQVCSVFFGGGTPSILPAEWIGCLLDALRDTFCFCSGETGACGPQITDGCSGPSAPGSGDIEPCEITIECNPGTADEQKLRAYRRMGINRLSLGLQSAANEELKLLGRIHTWEDFLSTYGSARAAGFTNINVDLMSALPGQTVLSWERTLQKVTSLSPEHISAYSLIVEEGTPFFERYAEDVRRRERGERCLMLPSEEEEREMYRLTGQYLAAAGMRRYEISNYALPGYECRHNCGYWRRTEYAGFGLGAASLLDNVRTRNPEELSAYLEGDFSGREREALSVEDQMEECMFLGLRMTDGVGEQEFADTFGTGIDDVYGKQLQKLLAQDLLCRDGGRIRLSSRGLDLANAVMAEFLF